MRAVIKALRGVYVPLVSVVTSCLFCNVGRQTTFAVSQKRSQGLTYFFVLCVVPHRWVDAPFPRRWPWKVAKEGRIGRGFDVDLSTRSQGPSGIVLGKDAIAAGWKAIACETALVWRSG